MTRRTSQGRWNLPARPPEAWLAPWWPLALGLLLGVAAALPVLFLPGRTVVQPQAVPVALFIAAFGVALGAYGLVVAGLVHREPRLSCLAAGFAASTLAFAARAPALRHGDEAAVQACTLAAHLAVPACVLAVVLARAHLVLAAVPLLGLAGLCLGTWGAGGDRVEALDISVPVVAGLAALLWWRSRVDGTWLTWNVATLALAMGAVASAVPAISDASQEPGLISAEGLGLGLPGLLLGALALNYHRQVLRWQRLEEAARRLRSRTALMPGRSITPDDDEGLPDAEAVDRLLAGTTGLALQPFFDLTKDEPVGYEALARFGGREPTDRWFRAAFAHGRGAELERRTLGIALGWQAELGDSQLLAVNVSPLALEDAEVLEFLASRDLHGLVIEITEHDAVPSYDRLRTTLATLRERGALIAVDDAGAGFASLRHVLMLQPDIVKLDVGLTREAADTRQAALVSALVAFAQDVGMQVLAEGVEYPEQVSLLQDLGVTLGQGFHLGRPQIVINPAPVTVDSSAESESG